MSEDARRPIVHQRIDQLNEINGRKFVEALSSHTIDVERIKEALEKALDDREYAQEDDRFVVGMVEAVSIIEAELGLKEAK